MPSFPHSRKHNRIPFNHPPRLPPSPHQSNHHIQDSFKSPIISAGFFQIWILELEFQISILDFPQTESTLPLPNRPPLSRFSSFHYAIALLLWVCPHHCIKGCNGMQDGDIVKEDTSRPSRRIHQHISTDCLKHFPSSGAGL